MCCHVAVGHVCGVWYSRPRSTTGKNGKTLRSKRKCAKMVSILVPRPKTVCDDWWVMIKDERTSVRCPQGSVLGPILYLLYTSPIGDIIRWHGLNYHLYADDTQLYLSFKPTPAEQPSSIAKIEACVSEIDSWVVCSKLKLNREKTEMLILSSRHRPPPLIEYVDVSGEPSPSARNIGVIFDEQMSLDKHVTSTCKASFFHLGNISKIRDCLSLADTEKLVHAFITSKLDNTNSLLYGLPKFMIDHLQNVQNAAALVTRTRKYDHIKPILKQLHWLPVSQRIDYKILFLTYKALNGQVPSYITELLKPYVPTRNLRSSSKNSLNVPSVNLVSYGHRCFVFCSTESLELSSEPHKRERLAIRL